MDIPSWSWAGWRTPVFWLPPLDGMALKDTRWTYEDRVKDYIIG